MLLFPEKEGGGVEGAGEGEGVGKGGYWVGEGVLKSIFNPPSLSLLAVICMKYNTVCAGVSSWTWNFANFSQKYFRHFLYNSKFDKASNKICWILCNS